ncbi:MAG: DNA gyrase subunit A [Chloroflexi bacterium]|nr:DNA gyrase subunit A [Chloroflexota bacterium]
MQSGVIHQRNINDEMRESYLDYAMSVIVSRALPDARDGLKPVHRRILYAMHDMGSGANAPYRKSARIVGEVLGKYHPHGDMAVYDAMVRMAQSFSMRYELVDGQGNFGSIDGDSAAAMRYTEARMANIGSRLLDDIDKNTVDFTDNFDGSLQEPLVLPASIPNLLVNGSSGIAVGMSTNIPPHNLNEVCDALVYILDNWENLDEISVHDLMHFIKGPDFPTGGLVYAFDKNGENQLVSAYATGRGKLIMRAKAHIEELGRGRVRIIVTEIPYQINKNTIIERIVSLNQSGKLEGLAHLRDESDREGLRIVIELTRGADPAAVMADLFKYTPLESTFGVINLALVDGEPRMLSLKQILRIYIEHRLEIIRRRSEFDLANAERRVHILAGLLTALDDIDRAIEIIRGSDTPADARQNLIQAFSLSEEQAQAILDMRLRRLAALERQSIQEEHDKLVALVNDLRQLLASPALMRMEIKRELKTIRQDYGDFRSTVIVHDVPSDISAGDLLVPAENTYIALTNEGRLSCTYDDELPRFRKNAADPPVFIVGSTTADVLYLFTPDGRAASVPVSQITQATNPNDGDHYWRLCDLQEDDDIVAVASVPPHLDEGYLFLTTRHGEVKRLRIEDLPGVRVEHFTVFNIEVNDRLIDVHVVFDGEQVVLVTHRAQAIRFGVEDVRPTGLTAGGMRGIRLKDDEDYVVGAGVVRPDQHLLVITPDARGKRSSLEEYPIQGRGGAGVRTMKAAKGQPNDLAGCAVVSASSQVMVLNDQGKVAIVDGFQAPETKRDYRGDFFFSFSIGERIETLRLILSPDQRPQPTALPERLDADEPALVPPEMAHFGDNGKTADD